MIDQCGHWPEDPLSDQHDGTGDMTGGTGGTAGGLAGEGYGSVWHDGPHVDPAGGSWVDAPGSHPFDSEPGADPDHAAVWHGAGGHGGTDDHADGAGRAGVDQTHPGPGRHEPTGGTGPEPPAAGDTADAVVQAARFHTDLAVFPPRLDLDVCPADGRDWVDVDLLGEPDPGGAFRFAAPADLLADLHRSDGADGEASWQAVTGSDDPAVRALGLRWRP